MIHRRMKSIAIGLPDASILFWCALSILRIAFLSISLNEQALKNLSRNAASQFVITQLPFFLLFSAGTIAVAGWAVILLTKVNFHVRTVEWRSNGICIC